MNKQEKALRAFQAHRQKMLIGNLTPEISGKLDRTENEMVELARLEANIISDDQAVVLRYSPEARRSRLFLSMKAGELHNPITLQSWIEALANVNKICHG